MWANAAWRVRYCDSCSSYIATLSSTRPIGQGQEVLVVSNPTVELDDVLLPLEVDFDGSAYTEGYGGSGISVWAHNAAGGSPVQLLTATMAISFPVDSMTAEALGGRLGLGVLLDLSPRRRAARMVGDNLPVVRFGANNARLRRTRMHMQLEDSIASILDQGWKLQWYAVPRRLNEEANRLAREGAAEARNILRSNNAGARRITIHLHVYDTALSSAEVNFRVDTPGMRQLFPQAAISLRHACIERSHAE